MFDQVVEYLLDLNGVQAEDGQSGLKFRVDLDAALPDVRLQQFEDVHDGVFNVVGLPDGLGGADGLEDTPSGRPARGF